VPRLLRTETLACRVSALLSSATKTTTHYTFRGAQVVRGWYTHEPTAGEKKRFLFAPGVYSPWTDPEQDRVVRTIMRCYLWKSLFPYEYYGTFVGCGPQNLQRPTGSRRARQRRGWFSGWTCMWRDARVGSKETVDVLITMEERGRCLATRDCEIGCGCKGGSYPLWLFRLDQGGWDKGETKYPTGPPVYVPTLFRGTGPARQFRIKLSSRPSNLTIGHVK